MRLDQGFKDRGDCVRQHGQKLESCMITWASQRDGLPAQCAKSQNIFMQISICM